ncbi:accessory gene regulator B family protein [Lysinibacillus sp. OL1_EC]|uniref:accessory gene regulator B family protein n=1 Tax=unclassified Lysinibacillus TaxID=2636778 RepID=UPI00187D56B3|nr:MULTISPECIES: accessory gene regulator B family protein [unclassified Lysinibacillus]MCM0624893.1 accessory gene regulator B family protein [Lysinibacillus sp. OL1_EC]MCS5502587.1 accessory gene regulator B family protein [Lysinibacillus sp. A4]UKJ45179.1 accessory gene regulator B family protein [Lysinibacillus sp. ACHW1.5]WGT40297.1 accessory gene regulator B family protein [Lysinibacillus sp. 1 U-2021]
MEEKLSCYLTDIINKNIQLSKMELAKINYGIATLLINLIKVSLIYSVSIMLGVVSETLVCHLVFCIMRRYCYGLHAKSSIVCSIIGVLYFSIGPFIVLNYSFSITRELVILLGIIFEIIIYYKVPAYTNNSRVGDSKEKRKKALIINFLIICGILMLNDEQLRLISFMGIFLSILLTIPIKKGDMTNV